MVQQPHDSIDTVIEETLRQLGTEMYQHHHPELQPVARWYVKRLGYNLNEGKVSGGHTPHFWLTVDVLLLHSYLMGWKEVKMDKIKETVTLIDSDEKLFLLRAKGSTRDLWADYNLYNLWTRREHGKKQNNLPPYKEIIDTLGQYKPVQEKWGRKLEYQKDVARKR